MLRSSARQGYIAWGGQKLDVSIPRHVMAGNHRKGIVSVQRNHSTRAENAAIKDGKEPEGSGQSSGGCAADAR